MNVKQIRTRWLPTLLTSLCLIFFTAIGYAADRYVKTSGSDVPLNGTLANPWKTISYAVANSLPGDIIHIGSGTFTEQVDVPKNLTLIGDGTGLTIIKSPAVLSVSFSTVGIPVTGDHNAVVHAHDAATVIIKNLTVDGNNYGNANTEFIGIAYHNAGGIVDNCKIVSIADNPAYLRDFGFGLYALTDNGIDRSLTVSNSIFTLYQKNATGFFGVNLTAIVDGNSIDGIGPLETIAQNGIQFYSGATGTIKNNKVKNIVYDGIQQFTATGILVVDPRSAVLIQGNELTNCQTAIFCINGDATVKQNKVLFTPASMGTADYWWSILVNKGNYLVTENEIDGGGVGTGIDAFSYANQTTVLTATYNIVKNVETGISTEVDETPGCVTGEIHYNSVTNAKEPLYNNQTPSTGTNCPTPCATCNWFGSASDADFASKFAGGGGFKYIPWLTNGTDAQPSATGFQPAANTINCSCTSLSFKVIAKKDVLCYGQDDGTATIAITGGTAPFSYKLDADDYVTVTSSIFTITDLEPGTHTIIVKDNTGATQSLTGAITGPVAPLDAQATSTADVKCNGAANGSVTITATGGTGPYTVVERPLLGTFTSSIIISNVSAGESTFTIKDKNGCIDQVTITLAEPTKLVVDATDEKTSCNGSTGAVTITASGGTPPYTGTGVKTGLAPGSYTFTVTDAKGCTASVVVTIDGTPGGGGFNVMPETFPNQFNTGFTKSLVNKTFIGSQGTWTVNSDENATMVVIAPYYSPSTSYALKVVNFKTSGCGDGWSKAVSPKLNLTGPCCPSEVKLNFTLWTYNVICNDTKASLEIDFSSDNGATWTEVWARTSGQLFTTFGNSGKGMVSIPVPTIYHNANFRYRIRGEMASGDVNNFYVFIDDINITSPAVCTPKGSIGNFVWNDANGNGKQDVGEAGIANVSVKLTLPDGSTQTKLTDASGIYNFTGLVAGTYTVTFTTPSGWAPTTTNAAGVSDEADSDPTNGNVTVVLGVGQNNNTIDAGYKIQVCTNTTNHLETFPNKFNTDFVTSLYNKAFTGSSGVWSVNSNDHATMVVTTPYYAPSSSYALKVVNFKTSSCGSGWTKAVSPKVDISEPCCPSQLKLNFTLWTYKVVCNDSKAALEIDFSYNNGSSWTEVWSKTSGQLYSSYGVNGKTVITIAIPAGYQTANFRYRIRGEMAANDCNNFYVFIDDIKIGSPANCSSGSSYARTTGGTEVTEPLSATAPFVTPLVSAKQAPSATETVLERSEDFAVRVFPNPTSSDFELQLFSKASTPIGVRIFDVSGRVVKSMQLSTANQSIQFGQDFSAGSYMVEVKQGEKREVVKLMKL